MSDDYKEMRKDELLPHVGKIIFKLLGNKYRILYQAETVFESELRDISEFVLVCLVYFCLSSLLTISEESNHFSHLLICVLKIVLVNSIYFIGYELYQGAYKHAELHLFIWAVLSNEREIAELFWCNSRCRMGEYHHIKMKKMHNNLQLSGIYFMGFFQTCQYIFGL